MTETVGWVGLRYAEAPVGERRFRVPAPYGGRRGDGAEFGPDCPQLAPRGIVLGDQPVSEDCLYLNVWSPAGAGSGRPVVVWVHGGSYVYGSGSRFDGSVLASGGDVVVVTVNYRLGPWGFVPPTLDGDGRLRLPPNTGLLDLVMALRWVRENISVYGGDPYRVTLAGHGSGAGCVLALMAMPVAAPLFRRAAVFSPLPVGRTLGDARIPAAALADSAGVDVRDLAGALRDSSTQDLTAMASPLLAVRHPPLSGAPFMPWVDGRVLPCHPLEAIGRGMCTDKELLVATCRDEGELLAVLDPAGLRLEVGRLRRRTGEMAWGRLVDRYDDEGRWTSAAVTDALYRLPALRLATAHAAAGGQTYVTQFDHRSDTAPFDRLGACHGADLPFLWSSTDGAGSSYFPGLVSPGDVDVAVEWQRGLTTFAHDGVLRARQGEAVPAYRGDLPVIAHVGLGDATPTHADLVDAWRGMDLG